jgi:hypothetical protein
MQWMKLGPVAVNRLQYLEVFLLRLDKHSGPISFGDKPLDRIGSHSVVRTDLDHVKIRVIQLPTPNRTLEG